MLSPSLPLGSISGLWGNRLLQHMNNQVVSGISIFKMEILKLIDGGKECYQSKVYRIIWVHQGASPLNPALWGLLWRAFGGAAPQTLPSGSSCGKPLGTLPREPCPPWRLLWRA